MLFFPCSAIEEEKHATVGHKSEVFSFDLVMVLASGIALENLVLEDILIK
jgi:hypothetical protein